MLNLPDVTLCVIETRPTTGIERVIAKCLGSIEFRDVFIISSINEIGAYASRPNLYVKIPPFRQYREVCPWWLTELPHIIAASDTADNLLFVAWDGYPVNPAAWRDQWLAYDFIGAPWPDGIVGNNGFSLASRRYFEAIGKLNVTPTVAACHPCDRLLAMNVWNGRPGYRTRLDEQGIMFAPSAVAREFSVENEPYTGSFGFHGVNTMQTLSERTVLWR